MNRNPHQVTKDFEEAVAEYTGARYVVSTNSCTMALLLAVAWHLRDANQWLKNREQKIAEHLPDGFPAFTQRANINIPKRTYVSVPMSIIHAGGRPTFRDEKWSGCYQLRPLPVWDSARWFTGGMCIGTDPYGYRTPPPFRNHAGQMVCVSFHTSKTLGDTQGGAILHDDPEADTWLRRARFDGRTAGVPPHEDTFDMVGWHCYMSPDVAARLLFKLSVLPRHNEPLPNDSYPDLSAMRIFQ